MILVSDQHWRKNCNIVRGNCVHRIGICDGSIFEFCCACTEVDFYFIIVDTFCRLIINVKPELKLNKDLLPIASMSSPAIANIFVSGWFYRSLMLKHTSIVHHKQMS